MKKIRIGSGAGYAGDRIEPAVELMEKEIWTTLFLSAWRNAPLRSDSRTRKKIRRRVTTSYSTTEWKKFSR